MKRMILVSHDLDMVMYHDFTGIDEMVGANNKVVGCFEEEYLSKLRQEYGMIWRMFVVDFELTRIDAMEVAGNHLAQHQQLDCAAYPNGGTPDHHVLVIHPRLPGYNAFLAAWDAPAEKGLASTYGDALFILVTGENEVEAYTPHTDVIPVRI